MSHPDPSCIITRFDSISHGQWSALQEMLAICCDSRHIEAKRRCHAGEIWVAIAITQAHRNAAGTNLTGEGGDASDTSDRCFQRVPTNSKGPWKPCIGPGLEDLEMAKRIVDGFTSSAARITENDVLLGSSSNSAKPPWFTRPQDRLSQRLRQREST